MTYQFTGNTPAGVTAPEAVWAAPNTAVTAPAVAPVEGYRFGGWTGSGVTVGEDGVFMMP